MCKSLLMAMPGRVAQAAASANPAELEALVQIEVDGAMAEPVRMVLEGNGRPTTI